MYLHVCSTSYCIFQHHKRLLINRSWCLFFSLKFDDHVIHVEFKHVYNLPYIFQLHNVKSLFGFNLSKLLLDFRGEAYLLFSLLSIMLGSYVVSKSIRWTMQTLIDFRSTSNFIELYGLPFPLVFMPTFVILQTC